MFHLAFFAAMSCLWHGKKAAVPLRALEWDMAHGPWNEAMDRRNPVLYARVPKVEYPLPGSFVLRLAEYSFAFLEAPQVKITSLFINTAGAQIPSRIAHTFVQKNSEHLRNFTLVGNTQR